MGVAFSDLTNLLTIDDEVRSSVLNITIEQWNPPLIIEQQLGVNALTIEVSSIVRDQDPWMTVPKPQRSIVRAYINSEAPVDKEHAHSLCEKYDLDYVFMRKLILDEMAAYECKRLERKA